MGFESPAPEWDLSAVLITDSDPAACGTHSVSVCKLNIAQAYLLDGTSNIILFNFIAIRDQHPGEVLSINHAFWYVM